MNMERLPCAKQEAQLSQKSRSMLRVIEYFANHSRSRKVIGNGTIRKLCTVSYSYAEATIAVFLAVSTQCTSVTITQLDMHRTTA